LPGDIAVFPHSEAPSEYPDADNGQVGEICGAAITADRGINYRPDLVGNHPAGTPADFAGLTPLPTDQPEEPDCTLTEEPQLTLLVESTSTWGFKDLSEVSLVLLPTDAEGAGPLLWHRRDDLAALSPGDTITTWPAGPGTAIDGTEVGDWGPEYTLDSSTGGYGGLFSARAPGALQASVISFPTLTLGDFTAFMVGRPLLAGYHGPTIYGAVGDELISVNSGGFEARFNGVQVATDGNAPAMGEIAIWSTRRTGTLWELRINGVLVASATDSAADVEIEWWHAYYNGPPGGYCWIPETIIWGRSLSADEDFLVWQYLITKYLEEPTMIATGTVLPFAGATPPAGYLGCDGAAVSRTTYLPLFTVIGTTWGPGDGSTTFNVPDFRGRALIGTGTGSGLTPRALADTGGAETHQLTLSEIPTHQHNAHYLATSSTNSGSDNVDQIKDSSAGGSVYTTDTQGGDGFHNNVQPFAAVNWIIKT